MCSCEKDSIKETSPFCYSLLFNTGEKYLFVYNSQKGQKDSVSKEESQFFSHLFSDKLYLGTFWCDKQFQENRLIFICFYLPSQATLSSFTCSPLRIVSCYLLQSYFYRLFSISSWSSLPDLGSLSDTHGFSNFLAFLQKKITLTDSVWRLSPKAMKSRGNLLWDTAKKLLVSAFKRAIVRLRLMPDCNKSFYAGCANTTPVHICFSSESVLLESVPSAL